MLDMQAALRQRPAPRLQVGLARSDNEVMEAQRLSYRVFADELGARLQTRVPDADQDLYDPYCDHLLVRDETSGRVVGTYRILSPSASRCVGGYYSESEFDRTRLQHLRGQMVESMSSWRTILPRSSTASSRVWPFPSTNSRPTNGQTRRP